MNKEEMGEAETRLFPLAYIWYKKIMVVRLSTNL